MRQCSASHLDAAWERELVAVEAVAVVEQLRDDTAERVAAEPHLDATVDRVPGFLDHIPDGVAVAPACAEHAEHTLVGMTFGSVSAARDATPYHTLT